MPDAPIFNLHPTRFPFRIEMTSHVTGQLLWSALVEEPGRVEIPGQDTLRELVDVTLRFPDGQWVRTTPDGESSSGHS